MTNQLTKPQIVEQDIREQIAKLPVETTAYENTPCRMRLSMRDIDQILNIKCSRGGGVCEWCTKGRVTVMKLNNNESYEDDCKECKGTGQKPTETKEVKEILKEWENES